MLLTELSPVTIGLIAVASYLLWRLFQLNNYWKQFGIDGPTPIPWLGVIGYYLMGNGIDTDINWMKKYGKVYGTIQRNGKPLLHITDPDLIKYVLVKDFHVFHNRRDIKLKNFIEKNLFRAEDDDWKRLRMIISPTFTSGKMKKMYPLISKCADVCLDVLDWHADNCKEVDIKDLFGCLTMDVIAKCAFGTDTNANKDRNNPFVVHGKGTLTFSPFRAILISLLPKIVLNMMGINSFAKDEHNQFFVDVTRHVIKRRRDNNEKVNDFLQLLMDCQLDDVDSKKEKESKEAVQDYESHHLNEGEEELRAEEKALNVNIVNKKLTEEEILAQAWVFFIAGYETTATTLSFCAYELALNPDIQQRLFEEINSTPKTGANDQIDYETLAKLPYLDAVIAETLRKYPPLMRLERRVMQRHRLGETKIVLSKDDLVEIPVYALHHCPDYYPDPEVFRPDRFLPENRHLIKPYTYLPFGTGPRNCVGMRFGLLETKLTLSRIILNYRFVKSANTDVPLKTHFKGLFNGVRRVIIGVEKR